MKRTLTQPFTMAKARWFAKRAPKSDSATLNLRNVYIFFSREGMLFAVLLLITFVAGINYGNNLVLGLCFYLVSVWLISFHVTFAHISGLQVRLLEVTMAEAGAPVWVTLQLRSTSRQPRRQLAFSFEQHPKQTTSQRSLKRRSNRQDNIKSKLAVAHTMNNRDVEVPTRVMLPRLQNEQVIRLAVATNQRGELELPRLQIKTVYPLGIMRAWSYVYFARSAWVYPKPLAFDWQEQYLATSSEQLLIAGQYKGQDDFERLDNYVAGESLARVSWAHVARGQGMLTKHFADPIGHEQTLYYADMPGAHHEQKLAQLAYGVLTLRKLDVPFTMQLPSDAPVDASVGQGEQFARNCLLRLAKAL